MNPQSVAIAGSASPLKSRYESEIKQKYFQNPPICSPIYPPPPSTQYAVRYFELNSNHRMNANLMECHTHTNQV